MQTQAYFENIKYHLQQELGKIQNSVYIAVAWFTDAELFNLICQKAEQGKSVELIIMDDEINNNCGINYNILVNNNGKLWKIRADDSDSIMHNKFCVIDTSTIITGSYNWTIKAQRNYENITIIKESPEIASQFIQEFNLIKEKYFGEDYRHFIIDYNKIILRLENLKNAISLEDSDDINSQINKLLKLISPVSVDDEQIISVKNIITLIKNKSFSEAIPLINNIVHRFKTLTIFIDPEISALKLEIKSLEIQISSLEDEKLEIEKVIYNFEIRYNNELGEIILKLLNLRKEKLKEEFEKNKTRQTDYEEAEKDYKEFQKNYEVTKKEKILTLTEEEKQELKTNLRKASKLCHPDVVAEEYKKEAERIFNELKQAYDKNDLRKVNEILENLEKGIFVSNAEKIDDKQQLKNIVNHLRMIRNELEKLVNEMKNSETYKTITQITDWDEYFADIKEKLLNELKNLEKM